MATKPKDETPTLDETPKAPRYKVLSPLLHDGADYRLGDTVELPLALADILVSQGVVAEID